MSHYERFISHTFLLLLMLVSFCSKPAFARVTFQMADIEDNTIPAGRPTFDKYTKLREQYVYEHQARALGSDVQLNEEEKHFNSILMDLKSDELARGFDNPFNFTPSRHIFNVFKSIESSPLFRLIQKMPKGAILHAHDDAICSTDYVVSLTKWEHLWQWGNVEADDSPKFLFSRQKPEKIDDIEWRLVSDIRKELGDDVYESKVRRFFTLIVDDPGRQYVDINSVWNRFMGLFGTVGSIVTYIEAWRDYYRQTLQELYDDNVQYLEFRGLLPELYDLDGKKYGPIECAQIYVDVLKEFKQTHPDFVGSKFIFAPLKGVEDETFDTYLPILQKLIQNFPDFIAGFDLVGQEDKGRPLIEYAEKLLNYPSDIQFYFHAGETNWMGTSSDENLIDAILLGTKRIGHGYALAKYPHLLKVVKEKRIAIEVNPISNQVLKLVDDIRNHPAAILFTDNYPVVISSDDPSFWGVKPLSHDFYYAFLGIASARQDLRTLKRLILNSFDYSALNSTEKTHAKKIWKDKWDTFIREYLRDHKSTILV